MAKPIFEYIDYRLFLRDYYNGQKQATRHFSFRYFAQKAGINSPSFLKHVIDGTRNLTPAVVEKFCTALKFSPKEQTFFRHLVSFNQSQIASEKQEHYAVLRSMAGNVREKILKGREFDYFDKWYSVVIRELVCLHDFKDDWQALSRAVTPSITAIEARKAVELLLELGLIAKNESGWYIQRETALAADDAITSMAVRKFTHGMINRAGEALMNIDKSERHISGLTVGVSRAAYDAIATEIGAFKDRIKAIVNSDRESSRVYQLNVALFPVSREMKPRQEETA